MNIKFDNLKSIYFLQKIFDFLPQKKFLKVIKYNKKIQQKLNISIEDYKKYNEIEIEIIPVKNVSGEFINIKDEDKQYYHVFFNDNQKEMKRNYLKKDDKVTTIKIILDFQIKSFYKLFNKCKTIKSIHFKRFNRNNIRNMSYMFSDCSNIETINLSNFNTENVINMQNMFGCPLLKELNLSNFNTENVTNMSYMFCGCKLLKELNISNFNTNKVQTMVGMFCFCSSLKTTDFSNFNVKNSTQFGMMFQGCLAELKAKAKAQIKDIADIAFLH